MKYLAKSLFVVMMLMFGCGDPYSKESGQQPATPSEPHSTPLPPAPLPFPIPLMYNGDFRYLGQMWSPLGWDFLNGKWGSEYYFSQPFEGVRALTIKCPHDPNGVATCALISDGMVCQQILARYTFSMNYKVESGCFDCLMVEIGWYKDGIRIQQPDKFSLGTSYGNWKPSTSEGIKPLEATHMQVKITHNALPNEPVALDNIQVTLH